jgi:2-polyprenyl-3-methyl-5-hydroxy-6-metoxy-1,4-benzoquinol methylase
MKSTGIFTLKQAMTEHQTSPRLAKALGVILPANKHVNDFGCGRGEYIRHLHSLGFKVTGYEGTEDMAELVGTDLVKQADITQPIKAKAGSVICLEVLEHIEPELEFAAINNLVYACNGRLVLSWAVEGQGGCGHVNERNEDYVILRIERAGFVLNVEVSEKLRTEAGKDLWWFRKSIYVFDKVTQ